MTTIGILGAGEVGSQLARAAVANGYTVVLADSRGPDTLTDLVAELGPAAAAAADVAVIAFPYRPADRLPVAELAPARLRRGGRQPAERVLAQHPGHADVGLPPRRAESRGTDRPPGESDARPRP